MTISNKAYQILKLTKDVGFGIIAILTTLLAALGVADKTVLIVVACVTAACQGIVSLINAFAKNHWKAKAEDGSIQDIEPIDTENK